MAYWQLHPLNARHGLTPILPELRAAAGQAVALVSARAGEMLPDFDLIVMAQPGFGSSDPVVGGYAPAPGRIELTLDPATWTPDDLIRTLVHEAHHLIRWDGPGYGRSLGEALVSEGLAGHFVTEILGGPPDPWDRVTPSAAALRRAISDWARPGHDHEAWFMGRGDLRRWTGYGLGHRLVAAYLDRHPDASAMALAHIRADEFRPILRSLIPAGSDEDAPDDPPEEPSDAPPQP